MNALIQVAFLLATILTGKDPDSNYVAGIYRTRLDFVNDRISNPSPYPVKLKHIFWREVKRNVEADDIIALETPGKQTIRIAPDSVFGFVNRGIKYLYSPAEKKYLLVLNDHPPVFIAVKMVSSIGYRTISSHALILFTKELASPFKEMTITNLNADFGGQAPGNLLQARQLLSKEAKYLDVSSQKEIRQCSRAVGKALAGE